MDLALPCMLNHSATTPEEPLVPQEQVGLYNKHKLMNTTTWHVPSASALVSNGSYAGNISLIMDEGDLNKDVKESSCGGAAIELDILKLSLNFSYSTEVRMFNSSCPCLLRV